MMIRDMVWQRQAAENRRQARLLQLVTRYVVGAVHAAAGNKKAGKIAASIDFLVERVRRVMRTEDAVRRFGPPLIGDGDVR